MNLVPVPGHALGRHENVAPGMRRSGLRRPLRRQHHMRLQVGDGRRSTIHPAAGTLSEGEETWKRTTT